jgi:hypothetical protein
VLANKPQYNHGEIMIKTKIVLGLAMVAMFAITVTPAMAQWTNHGGKGKGKAGEGTFTYFTANVKCASAKGNYTVNAGGTAVKLEEIVWEKCKALLESEATVTCKGLQMEQMKKEGTVSGTALGTVTETCTVKATGCEIIVGTTGNSGLKSIALEKAGANQKDKVNVGGITATAKGSLCKAGGAKEEKTTTATEKVPTLELEGVGLE